MEKAVVLLSGGLDSATVLADASAAGLDCHALSFAYGQRHSSELEAARRVAEHLGATEHKILSLDLDKIGGSALTDNSIDVPVEATTGIPVTYVPARNTIFLAMALGWAEVLKAAYIYIGVNAVDYSGYPDCRPEFIRAFGELANLATQTGVAGSRIEIMAPLIHLTKAEIIRKGMALGVNYGLTVSCYQADSEGRACGLCDSCRIRAAGFQAAGTDDPTHYQ